MSYTDERHLNRTFDRLERELPRWIARPLRWLRIPSARWIRVPVGLLFVLGGVFSILPLLGLWMLPIGMLLLAQDVPFLRRPTRRALLSIERRWVRAKRARRARRRAQQS
jgi:hypothetical protein